MIAATRKDTDSGSVFVIAEVGSVHDGSFGNATKLIELAAKCGADAIKFQTHIASAETLRDAPMPSYFKGEPRYEYFERTGFDRDQWRDLKRLCGENRIEFISSPFSNEAVALLYDLGVCRYKIPSGEVTNIPMLEAVAETGKPVLLSSGMSDWQELDTAVDVIRRRHDRLTVLQCTSTYPCPDERVGLNVIPEMRTRWNVAIGFSDHTRDNYAAFAAVALGAVAVEKHLTFSRAMYGSDAANSAEPNQFSDLVVGIRAIERMSASIVDKDDVTPFAEMKDIFQKSLVALVPISAGTVLAANMIGIKKPGHGIPPARLHEVIGRRARHDLAADTLLSETDIDWVN